MTVSLLRNGVVLRYMWLHQFGYVLMDYGCKSCAVECAIMP
jgi:hypothetical protein